MLTSLLPSKLAFGLFGGQIVSAPYITLCKFLMADLIRLTPLPHAWPTGRRMVNLLCGFVARVWAGRVLCSNLCALTFLFHCCICSQVFEMPPRRSSHLKGLPLTPASTTESVEGRVRRLCKSLTAHSRRISLQKNKTQQTTTHTQTHNNNTQTTHTQYMATYILP